LRELLIESEPMAPGALDEKEAVQNFAYTKTLSCHGVARIVSEV
jgi:hypothetical protein